MNWSSMASVLSEKPSLLSRTSLPRYPSSLHTHLIRHHLTHSASTSLDLNETRACAAQRQFLSTVPFFFQNVSIGIVGKDMEFTIYDDDDVAPFLEGLEERPQRKVLQRFIQSSSGETFPCRYIIVYQLK